MATKKEEEVTVEELKTFLKNVGLLAELSQTLPKLLESLLAVRESDIYGLGETELRAYGMAHRLNKTEADILVMRVYNGYTIETIANRLHYHKNNIRRYLKSIEHKLNVKLIKKRK